jgi:hypothetical protein
VGQPLLDMPEVLWKAYIDFETELEQFENARELYERLLKKTNHVKVCIYAWPFWSSSLLPPTASRVSLLCCKMREGLPFIAMPLAHTLMCVSTLSSPGVDLVCRL